MTAEFIEGKVDGQTIVIITQYVKKLYSLSLQCLNWKVLSLDLCISEITQKKTLAVHFLLTFFIYFKNSN
jgi:hypothetical protein